MQRVHFIGLGGVNMHNLAIAIQKKSNFQVTGSDSEIIESSLVRLQERGLVPEKMGWFPERITKNLNAVVIGRDTTSDNPELIRAKELGLKIYSFPEYLFQQTRSKTRIVVSGSFGKTTVTAMILFVLKKSKIDADYFIGNPIPGFENPIKFSYDSRIAVFEGDEHLTSLTDPRPKFHLYKPHIAVLTGISKKPTDSSIPIAEHVLVFEKFAELMEVQGRLIYYEKDENLKAISGHLRRDIVPFPYDTPKNKVRDGVTYLITKYGDFPLQVSGDFNLQNLDAARLACRQIGVTDEQFYTVITEYSGI